MRLYNIGITGHRPHKFKNPDFVKRQCEDVVVIMQRHYGDALRFNLGGCTGTDQWVGEACLRFGAKYNLYLPFPAEIQSQHWYDEQKKELDRQVANCESLSVLGPEYVASNYFERDKQIVDNSDFVIAFWEGPKQGGTYITVKYAVEQSKIVLNALTDLSMITGEHLVRTPRREE